MNRFLKKICTGILCGVLGVVSIGAQETFAADAKEMRAVWISTVYSADYPSTTNNAEAQKNEFIQKLEQAQALGLNTVVVQVRPKGDALYQSELNPWRAVLTGAQGTNPGYDVHDCGSTQARHGISRMDEPLSHYDIRNGCIRTFCGQHGKKASGLDSDLQRGNVL